MNSIEHDDRDNMDQQLDEMLAELIELRQAVANALGPRQFLYQVLDEAVATHYAPRLQSALDEFAQQPHDVRELVIAAVRRGR